MSTAALTFLVLAWGIIISSCVITLRSLVKHSK